LSGTGVVIDPRGVILTNAHVAQYVLLSENPAIDLACEARTGSPAVAKWKIEVLYIPQVWVDAHVSDIRLQEQSGTGEHDFALLFITGSIDGSQVPTLPYLSPDTREAIAFQGDDVLVASYPAEFTKGISNLNDLYAATSYTSIQKLLTFVTDTADLLSLGGIIEAQSGSSGGAVVNQWDKLVGIVVTTSLGNTTDSRDLHALSLSYISRDMAAQTGLNLPATLAQDVASLAKQFTDQKAPAIIDKYVQVLRGQQ
jgi:hypothetical protein